MEGLTETTEQMQNLIEKGYEMGLNYAPKFVLAILTLLFGLWLVGRLSKKANAHFANQTDPTLGKFVSSVVSVILRLMLFLAVASMVGIETTSFIAVLGAAGLAVGLALQGSLANFAGGVLILFFKPYKVGDVIEASGFLGTVKEIQIFNTVLLTPDNRTVFIPNGELSNGALINLNKEPTRRVDMVFGIGYNDDIDKAKLLLERIVKEDQRIFTDKAYTLAVSELADSSVNFVLRVWVNSVDYWDVYFDMHEKVKKVFDAEGVSIPFPQQDVHMHQVTGE